MACRPATVNDVAFISRVVISSWRDAYVAFLPRSLLASLDESPHHDRRSWETRLSDPTAVTRIVSEGAGNDVGVLRVTIGASSIPGTDSELTTLYVLPHARERGLGTEALAYARAEASRPGTSALGLGVLAGNKRGQRFYERLGARPIGERIAFRWENRPVVECMYLFG